MKGSSALAPVLSESARLVARVASGKSLADLLGAGPRAAVPQSRSALIDLTYGTLRRYGRVQAIVAALSQRQPDPEVEALLWCAIYALDSGRYAEYTVVDQAVRACGVLEKWPAKGFVNGVLRRYLRERAKLEDRLLAEPSFRYWYPRWWIEGLRAAHPRDWEAILASGNAHPPMCLRVNRRRTGVDEYSVRLDEAGISHRPAGRDGILVDHPVPVDRLPGFADGHVSVQDLGAQRARDCMELHAGQRVLDACSAPGGKAAHLLESTDVFLTALELDPLRMERLAANLDRLGLAADLRAGDATDPRPWWDGKAFDRILADVPCSASGAVRRHPDMKWLRRPGDLAAFAARQGAILDSLWRLLHGDGKLLYVTCSVFPQENEQVVEAFVARTAGAVLQPLADGLPAQWPPDAEHDGFFYSVIHKEP